MRSLARSSPGSQRRHFCNFSIYYYVLNQWLLYCLFFLNLFASSSMVRSSNATENSWSGNALLVSSIYTYMENIS